MTFFRIEVKTLSKSSRQASLATFQYDNREKHKDKSDLSEVGSINMPIWGQSDPSTFWSAADKYERENASLARRVIISFPNEIPASDRETVIIEWLAENCKDLPASWAIHDDPKSNPANPHCHLLISERQVDGIDRSPEQFFRRYNAANPEKGGCKKKDIGSNRKQWLSNARQSWADVLNKRLPKDKQVDHRSLADQGITNRDPQKKFGQKVLGAERRGKRTKLVSSVLEDSLNYCKIRCLTFTDETGRETTFRTSTDHGDHLQVVGKPTIAKCIDIVKAAQEKGWKFVELTGSDEFKAMMRKELRKAGIKIEGEQDEQNIRCDRNENGGGGQPDRSEGRGECTERTSSDRSEYGTSSRSGRGSFGGNGEAGADAEYPKTEAAAKASLGATGEATASKSLFSVRPDIAGMRSDIEELAQTFEPPGKDKDLTSIMVQKQLKAIKGTRSFELGILDSKGKMQTFFVTVGEILAKISNIKRKNAQGSNVYIRPDPSQPHPYVLLDDLGIGTINKMKADGFEACLQIETSPMNYQVLIRLPESQTISMRKQVERVLQEKYKTDLGSCDGQHFFRLSGFTNRKKIRQQENGQYPYVKVSYVQLDAVLSSDRWIELRKAAEIRLLAEMEKMAKPLPLSPSFLGGAGGVMVLDNEQMIKIFTEQFERMRIKYPNDFDQSRADFVVARNAFQHGHSRDQIAFCLEKCSPRLSDRHHSKNDYLNRTLDKAYQACPDLIARDHALSVSRAKAAEAERARCERVIQEQAKGARKNRPFPIRPNP